MFSFVFKKFIGFKIYFIRPLYKSLSTDSFVYNNDILLNNNKFQSSVSFFKYAHKYGKPVIIPFSYLDLLSKKVISLVEDKIEEGFCYTVIIKVKYGDDQYYMVGKNFVFKYDDTNNSDNISILYNSIYGLIDFFLTSKPSGQDLDQDDIHHF
jgi:hypothetical protein